MPQAQCGSRHGRSLLRLVLVQIFARAMCKEGTKRFIIASSPSEMTVYVAPVPDEADAAKPMAERPVSEAKVLIDGNDKCAGTLCTEDSNQGLKGPHGIAVYHGPSQAVLYVADTPSENVYAYNLLGVPGSFGADSVKAGPQRKILMGLVGVSGLAVDDKGNLYFTTNQGAVGKVSADELNKPQAEQHFMPGYTTLYASGNTISSPFAIAADAFHLFWTNKESASSAGTVVKAMDKVTDDLKQQYPDLPKALAMNADKSMGVCLVNSNVFYTGEATYLYGVSNKGGGATEVYADFGQPRGCTDDHRGGVLVADVQKNAVYSVPAGMKELRPVTFATKVASVPNPEGIAVFVSSPRYGEDRVDNGFLGLGW